MTATAHRMIEDNRELFEHIAKLHEKAEEMGLMLDDDYDLEDD